MPTRVGMAKRKTLTQRQTAATTTQRLERQRSFQLSEATSNVMQMPMIVGSFRRVKETAPD
mgnify:CR=1 FL=1